MRMGEGRDIAYSVVTGMRPDLTGAQCVPQLLQQGGEEEGGGEEGGCEGKREVGSGESEDEESSDGDWEEEEEVEGEESGEGEEKDKHVLYVHPRGTNKGDPAQLELKRAHKASVKEEKREKRKTKVPKHVKKRKEKLWKLRHSK
ncbi:Serine/threonine-protein kinase RIO1 [Geodia barretti]|uniref:Serine/threonine-protein kinase RIO1 n=1 Tax=Geodia barretti TaxID=519541 RepID=A0AA35RFM7_GEOBA|nr:Serine/threonine-protein kinase RIO1 [Geodia barretti]